MISFIFTERNQEEVEDEILEEWAYSKLTVLSFRYSIPTLKDSVPKTKKFFYDILPNLDENRFRQFVRMNRANFEIVLKLIEDDVLFNGASSGKQFPVAMQLAIVLYRLGCNGEGASVAKIASFFGIGDGGTIQRVTELVFQAILKIKQRFLFWPDAKERQSIVRNTFFELPHCIGYVDGTEIKLAEKPSDDPESYFSRKHVYSLKVQAVCEYKLRIRHMVLGYPGSVHDSRIYNNCELALKPSNHLSGDEWIAADSAYKLTNTVITPFRTNSNDCTLQQRNEFNNTHSKYRVRIENCFGILKERFNSLKELKIQIKDDASVRLACRWVLVCAILHNIIIEQENGDTFDIENLEDSFDNDEVNENQFQQFPVLKGEHKRRAIIKILNEMSTLNNF
ncbi:uncharacterized protein LOC125775375 [Bactrocera dorsalis]|uniref:Uncharacterized protein LOC125775375 n=1 Tax=Bactrocera dorsalis TaxID=27457 RepID=A0ABM3IY07_BACDO|nr:uncharacterized protein LOC125775375 [Bactrocera dorsalis]